MRLLSQQGKQTSPTTSGTACLVPWQVASGKWQRQLQLIAYFKRLQIKTADNVNNNNNNNKSTLRLMPMENIKNEHKQHKRELGEKY